MRLVLAILLALQVWAATPWEAGFRDPAPEYGMGVYWWWFGPAVTKQEAARELEVMAKAKISYVLIFPIYPLSTDDPARGIRNLRYLSPEFLDVLGYTAATAKKMGFTVDVLAGTGWPYGGPSIRPENGIQRLAAIKAGELPPRGGVFLAEVGGLRFFQAPQGMQVKRPSLGAEGLVLDHLSRQTVRAYLEEVGAKLVKALAGNVRALHSDSLEAFGSEWTEGLLQEFQRRRGYDLSPHLPDLFSDNGALARDVRYDYWRTVIELANENYVRTLHDWCRAHGVGFQSESYGTPPVDMTSFASIDHPMGESYDWKTFVASRWASSAAHQYGKRVTAAEAYTWLRIPRYIATLQDLKLGTDLHLLCGVNKMVAHGYAYSPPVAGVPGWGYYASVMLNDNNTFWPYFPLLSDYVRRASYALTLGKPKVDVALYLPEDDVMADHPAGQGLNLYGMSKRRLADGGRQAEFSLPEAYKSESAVIKTILNSGYSMDGFDRSILQDSLDVSAGRLAVGDVRYRIVVLPNLRGIALPVLEKLAAFCRAGGTVIATRRLPETAYGFKNHEADRARVRALVKEIFSAGDGPRRTRCGKGEGIFVADDRATFARTLLSLDPEVRLDPADQDIYMVHRGEGGRDLYFLANTSDRPKSLRVTFRDAHGKARFWDAMDGSISDAGTGRTVPLDLEPYGSIIVVFDAAAGPAPRRAASRLAGDAVNVAGPWTLAFGAETHAIDQLGSWTSIESRRFFSGRGEYRATVDLPAGHSGWRLEMGEVREIADVKINGQPAGVCWKLPYALDVSRFVRPGRNTIEVAVTNLLINRVLGGPAPDFSGLAPLRFPQPSEKKLIPEPLPSGLVGPVRLVPVTAGR